MKGYLGLQSFPDGKRSRVAEPDIFPMGIPGTGKEGFSLPDHGYCVLRNGYAVYKVVYKTSRKVKQKSVFGPVPGGGGRR